MPPTNHLRPSPSTFTTPCILRPQPQTQSLQKPSFSTTTPRPARLLRRPKRPYTFTQLITLSDGSTFTQRTTSPLAVYRSNKDARNTLLWNPSNVKMANVEEDEAGRLRAFRRRFGRGWDARSEEIGEVPQEADLEREGRDMGQAQAEAPKEGEAVTLQDGEGVRVRAPKRGEVSVGRQGTDEKGRIQSSSEWSDEAEDNLMDLIGSYGVEEQGAAKHMVDKPRAGGKGKKR